MANKKSPAFNQPENPAVTNILEKREHERDRRAAQARINGAKSHGPTTPEGKRRSSRAPLRHGLCANEHTVLPVESLAEYKEVYDAFLLALRPDNKAELRLVEKIANLDWRLERLAMMETAILALDVSTHGASIVPQFRHLDAVGLLVESWRKSTATSGEDCLNRLRRYMATLQSQLNSTQRNFRDLEKHRLARTHAGIDLDEARYRPPQMETFLEEQQEIVPPDENNEEVDVDVDKDEATTTPSDPAVVEFPKEPIAPTKETISPPIPKRPAA